MGESGESKMGVFDFRLLTLLINFNSCFMTDTKSSSSVDIVCNVMEAKLSIEKFSMSKKKVFDSAFADGIRKK
jgi:hypothetical protein